MSTATAQNIMPIYAPNPSPRVAQARLVAEQQAQMAQRALQSGVLIDPRITGAPTTLPPVQVNGIARMSTPPGQGYNSQQQGQNTPSPNGKMEAQTNGSRNGTPAASTAQNIPSISSLVHATDTSHSVPSASQNSASSLPPPAPGSDRNSPRSSGGSRAGSNSPSNRENGRENCQSNGPGKRGENGGRPKDIPHEKLNILGEDQRAIRVLDRKFCI
jgi:hypothetical protein